MNPRTNREPAFRLYRPLAAADTNSKHLVNTRPGIPTQLYLCRIVQIVLPQSMVDRLGPRRYLNETPSRDVFSFPTHVACPVRGSCSRRWAIS